MECKNCKKELSRDERAVYKRLIDRTADDTGCLCKQCLAAFLEIPVDVIDKKIAHFKSVGCRLFM